VELLALLLQSYFNDLCPFLHLCAVLRYGFTNWLFAVCYLIFCHL